MVWDRVGDKVFMKTALTIHSLISYMFILSLLILYDKHIPLIGSFKTYVYLAKDALT